jgi:mannose-6-phosphate isomerase-like protein (cupin superfamily)
VGGEQGLVSTGEMALVPAMLPHSVRTVSNGRLLLQFDGHEHIRQTDRAHGRATE